MHKKKPTTAANTVYSINVRMASPIFPLLTPKKDMINQKIPNTQSNINPKIQRISSNIHRMSMGMLSTIPVTTLPKLVTSA